MPDKPKINALWAEMYRRHEQNPAFTAASYLVRHYAEDGNANAHEITGTGAFFPAAKLPNAVLNKYAIQTKWIAPDGASYARPHSEVWEKLSKKPRLCEKLANRLNALGFRRIAFLESASYSSVFVSAATEDGLQRIIKISPFKKEDSIKGSPTLPLFLPPIHEETVEAGRDKIRLSISPKVKILEGKGLWEAIELMDAKADFWNKHLDMYMQIHDVENGSNLGIYSFKKGGIEYTLPVIIDEGCCKGDPKVWHPEIITDEMRQELKPWFEMQEYIQSLKNQNLCAEDRLSKLKKGTGHAKRKNGSSLVNAIEQHGLFPDEVANLAQVALSNDGDFSQNLSTLLTGIDTSNYPYKGR